MNRRFALAAVGLAFAALAASGAARAVDPGAVIKNRQEFYKTFGKSMKGLMEELKKSDPSVAELKKLSAVFDGEAGKIPGLFPAGTGPDAGIRTGAKPEIWEKRPEFEKDAADFAAAAHALDAAADSGDVAATRKAAHGLGEACKTCHETFRRKEH